MSKTIGLLLGLLMTASTAWAAVTAAPVQQDGKQLFVLENDKARIEVWPEAGGAITSYVDKRNNVNFVAGTVRPGKPYYGWKSTTRLHPNDPATNWLGAHPYAIQVREGALVAINETQFLRTEREMRLADDSTELTVIITQTNISQQPRTLWARWHPYMKIDDRFGEYSVILAPGPEKLTVRRLRVGQGWESHLMDMPGYWMVANAKTGVGMWMTFDVGQMTEASTWTGTKFGRSPKRGWFVAEIYPKPRILQPGQRVVTKFTYQPFVADDATETLSKGFIPQDHHDAAQRFARLTRNNLRVLLDHTMVPYPNNWTQAEAQNRFGFSHKRRDRFIMTDWGIFDAMMSVPGIQSESARLRLYARVFDGVEETKNVEYRLTVTDAAGDRVIQKRWVGRIDPVEFKEHDHRRDVALNELPDGRYVFTLTAIEQGVKEVQHRVVHEVKLAENIRKKVVAERIKRDAPPLIDRERPVVRALRTMDLSDAGVPIAVEEAGGIDRTNWPVRVGVPFAEGVLPRGGTVTLTGPDGKVVSVQTTEMGHWFDGPVKWLLVEFSANVKANSFALYTLKVGGSANTAKPIAAEENGAITINTGARQWQFDTAAEAPLFGLIRDKDAWWTTGDGTRYQFRVAGEDAGITLESNGPERAVMRIVGWYFADGKTRPIARGEFRAEFLKGQTWWRLYHTYTYAGDPWEDSIGSMGLAMRFADRKFTGSAVELDGDVVSSAGASLLNQITEDYVTVGKQDGKRSNGAVALTDGSNRTSIYHRGLWKMFPKHVDINPTARSVKFHYWPQGAGEFSWKPDEDTMLSSSSSAQQLAVGASRTHEFIIDEQGSIPLEQYDNYFDEPVLGIVAPRYVCATQAIPGLQAYDPVNCPNIENAVSEMTDSYQLNREVYGWYGQWRYGSMPNVFDQARHRWANHGRYGNILNEQDICHAPWLAYLRSGDRRHFKFAESNTRHLMEVGTIRLNPIWPEHNGMSRRHHEVPWLGGGDYGHSMLDPFLELYHVTGYTPAWEAAVRMAEGMAEQRSGTWRYISNPVSGLTRMYIETGEKHYIEQAHRIWRDLCYPEQNVWWHYDHGSRMVRWYSDFNEDCLRLWTQWTDSKPSAFQSLDALGDLYRRTGNVKYAVKAAEISDKYIRDVASNDQKREDPMFWSIATITQYTLQRMREWSYAPQTVIEGRAHRGQKKSP